MITKAAAASVTATREPAPPTMTMITICRERLRLKVSLLTKPMAWPKSEPATPAIAPEMTKARSL